MTINIPTLLCIYVNILYTAEQQVQDSWLRAASREPKRRVLSNTATTTTTTTTTTNNNDNTVTTTAAAAATTTTTITTTTTTTTTNINNDRFLHRIHPRQTSLRLTTHGSSFLSTS